jgi:hypothetical protein
LKGSREVCVNPSPINKLSTLACVLSDIFECAIQPPISLGNPCEALGGQTERSCAGELRGGSKGSDVIRERGEVAEGEAVVATLLGWTLEWGEGRGSELKTSRAVGSRLFFWSTLWATQRESEGACGEVFTQRLALSVTLKER